MKIYPRDPDLATIYTRIKDHQIDLQPDFQRDLVWSVKKKQSLIDTILRDWHFPPVFLVIPNDGSDRLDVLDGQQRLNAIFEFVEGWFPVDGKIEPTDDNIKKLDGLTYENLPPEVRSRFNRYSIRVCELYEYKEQEPYELFFRLNQGSALTAAEKRNTFYGPIREQVRDLVNLMGNRGLNVETIGFNNNRLAYQDVVSRLIYALQYGSIKKKITDEMLVDFFRSSRGISPSVFSRAECAIHALADSISRKIKLNKATLFTWLLFFSFELPNKNLINRFYDYRTYTHTYLSSGNTKKYLLDIFQEKSASSVNDATPVQIRLLIVYLFGISISQTFSSPIGQKAHNIFELLPDDGIISDENLIYLIANVGWGIE